MGRAKIIAEIGKGRYTIELDWGVAEKNRQISALSVKEAEVTSKLVALAPKLTEAEQVEGEARAAYDNEVMAFVADTQDPNKKPDAKPVTAAYAVLVKANRTADNIRRRKRELEAQSKALADRRAMLNNLQLIERRDAWCADYTVDKSGNGFFGTIDIPGDSGLILLKPGIPAATASDGQLFARELMSPEQAFYNVAALPGWQKDKPTYRWGTVTGINYSENTCTVELGAAVSTGQRLNVNKTDTLENVPVTYMGAPLAGVFELDDRVVIEFQGQDWGSPRIIGFLDNPKAPVRLTHVYGDTYIFNFHHAVWDDRIAYYAQRLTCEWRYDGGAWQRLVEIQPYVYADGSTHEITEFWPDGTIAHIQYHPPEVGNDNIGDPWFLFEAREPGWYDYKSVIILAKGYYNDDFFGICEYRISDARGVLMQVRIDYYDSWSRHGRISGAVIDLPADSGMSAEYLKPYAP